MKEEKEEPLRKDRIRTPMEAPKYERGDVLRFAVGASAFFKVTQICINLRDVGWSYVGQHVLEDGPMVGPINEERCSRITPAERRMLLESLVDASRIRDGVL